MLALQHQTRLRVMSAVEAGTKDSEVRLDPLLALGTVSYEDRAQFGPNVELLAVAVVGGESAPAEREGQNAIRGQEAETVSFGLCGAQQNATRPDGEELMAFAPGG